MNDVTARRRVDPVPGLVAVALLFCAYAAMLLAGDLFPNARSSPAVSLILASGFVMASVAPACAVWTTPELRK